MRPPLAAVLLCAALAACAGGGKAPVAQETTAPPKPTALATDLKDGRHYAYLKSMDTAKLTLTLDVVQFLTGEEAEKAAQEDGEEAYDYYVRNQNTRLRTLTVAPNAAVVVNTLTAEETGSSTKDTAITLGKLKEYFTSGEAQQRLFYVTLAGGRVVKINEQYLP